MLARPALAVGVSLALLETLNDIGASEFLGIQTLTVAVYTTWITRSDLAGAAQIACAMLFVVVALVLLERNGRRHQRHSRIGRWPGPKRGIARIVAGRHRSPCPGQHVQVIVEKALGTKCERCWKYTTDVGQHTTLRTICGACVRALEENGNV